MKFRLPRTPSSDMHITPLPLRSFRLRLERHAAVFDHPRCPSALRAGTAAEGLRALGEDARDGHPRHVVAGPDEAAGSGGQPG